MIAIVDYGLGNLKSIYNMLSYLNKKSVISSNPEEIAMANKIILPGVGSFDAGVLNLRNSGLGVVLDEEVITRKKPILGICLGMQLLTTGSEEGELPGLGWIKAFSKKFRFSSKNLKIPHMGWNYVRPVNTTSLFKGLDTEKNRFYFVHSYYVECANEENVLAKCSYGNDFACAIVKDNIYGVQFHPEKSHKFGMTLLKNFAEL
jgi:glutamine amidotransferase